jgi:hypothetical protein
VWDEGEGLRFAEIAERVADGTEVFHAHLVVFAGDQEAGGAGGE